MGAILFSEQQAGAPITKVAKKRFIPIQVASRVKGFVTDSARTRTGLIQDGPHEVQHPIFWHRASKDVRITELEFGSIFGGLNYGSKNTVLTLPKSVRFVTAISGFWAAPSEGPSGVAKQRFVMDFAIMATEISSQLGGDINVHADHGSGAGGGHLWLSKVYPIDFLAPFAPLTDAQRQAAIEFRGGDSLVFVLLNKSAYQKNSSYEERYGPTMCTGTPTFTGYTVIKSPHPTLPHQKHRELCQLEIPRFRNHHVIICRIPLEGDRRCEPIGDTGSFLLDPFKEDEDLITDLQDMVSGTGRYASSSLGNLGWELRTISKDEPYSTFTNLAKQYFGIPSMV